MRIFDFFKGKKKLNIEEVEIPVILKNLVSKDDFNSILTFAIKHLKERGYINISFDDGFLFYETSGKEGVKVQANFVNLVKSIICEEPEKWEEKVIETFENIEEDKELESEILSDFQKAKEYLTVSLQPAVNYTDEPYKSYLEKIVYKIDVPETYSVLALDLPSRFNYLTIEEVNAWGITIENLFEIAHNNLLDKVNNIQFKKHDLDGAVFYTLFDRDYSASYCVDFANTCNNLIGEKGSLVSFPSKGSVFIHPITTLVEFDIAYDYIIEQTNQFFNSEPSPISRNIYWFNVNQFTQFKLTQNGREFAYNIPEQLINLFYN